MRFDVTVPATGASAPVEHRGIAPDAVAELVDHAAANGLRLRVRPHRAAASALHPGEGEGEAE